MFFYFLGQEGDVEHIRSFGYVFRASVVVDNLDAVVGWIVHVFFNAGGGDEIGGVGWCYAQLLTDLAGQFLFSFFIKWFVGDFYFEDVAVHHALTECGKNFVRMSAPYFQGSPDVVVIQQDEILQTGGVTIEDIAVDVVVEKIFQGW